MIDATGADHRYRGKTAMLEMMVQKFAQSGVEARVTVAYQQMPLSPIALSQS